MLGASQGMLGVPQGMVGSPQGMLGGPQCLLGGPGAWWEARKACWEAPGPAGSPDDSPWKTASGLLLSSLASALRAAERLRGGDADRR